MRRFGTYFSLALATGLGFGLSPRAPGTMGTLWGVVIFWAVAPLPWWYRLLVVLGVTLVSFVTAEVAGRHWGIADDQRIVIDEVAGYLVGAMLLPFNWITAGAVFVLFRLFDITKPWPAGWFDRSMHNGIGVTMDDVMAGVYTAGLLHLARWLLGLAGVSW